MGSILATSAPKSANADDGHQENITADAKIAATETPEIPIRVRSGKTVIASSMARPAAVVITSESKCPTTNTSTRIKYGCLM